MPPLDSATWSFSRFQNDVGRQLLTLLAAMAMLYVTCGAAGIPFFVSGGLLSPIAAARSVEERSAAAVDQQAVAPGCRVRAYTMNVSSGSCWGLVNVRACWGYCESWQVSEDTLQTLCGYHEGSITNVELPNCATDVGQVLPEVVTLNQAVACSCRSCELGDTACSQP